MFTFIISSDIDYIFCLVMIFHEHEQFFMGSLTRIVLTCTQSCALGFLKLPIFINDKLIFFSHFIFTSRMAIYVFQFYIHPLMIHKAENYHAKDGIPPKMFEQFYYL